MTETTREGAEVLLTGATGFLGKVVLHDLVRRSGELGVSRIHLLIRESRRRGPEARWRSEIAASPCFEALPDDWQRRVQVVGGDCAAPGAGIGDAARDALLPRVTHVIHCAASVQFDLPLAEAASANITSALHVLALARAFPRLAHMVSVSTAYVSPHPGDGRPVAERLAPLPAPPAEIYAAILDGSADERALFEATGHPNTYTLTKCVAEHLLAERGAGLPLTLIRPSIISASLRDPRPGWIDSPAAFALFIMSIAAGRMRAVIADPGARLDVVPCDVVASRVVEAAFAAPRAGGGPIIRHVVAGFARSPTLAQCRRVVEDFFERNPVSGAGGRHSSVRIRYLGPGGLHYRLRHWLHHRRRPDGRLVADRVEQTNRVFSYFTKNTFRFESSRPLEDPSFEPRAYIETVCRGVLRNLLDGDESETTLAGRLHKRARGDLYWALARPRTSAWLRVAAYFVCKALRRCTDRVSFDLHSLEAALAAVPPGAHVVLAPSHRSYLDFVLVPYLVFARPDLALELPHVAADAAYARIPLLGWLFSRLNAFYVQRGTQREEKQLAARVHELIRRGQTLELFVEGHRSRDRLFLPPQWGLLRSLQATGGRVALLPLAISYERVSEEASFLAELRGGPPAPRRLRDLASWSLRVARGRIALGRIHLAWGRIVLLDMRSDVHEVGRAVMEQLQDRMAVTTRGLRAFLQAERARLEGIDLRWLRSEIEGRGGRVLESAGSRLPIRPAVERCLRHQFEHLFYPEAARAFSGHPAIEHRIRSNGYAHPTQARDAGGDPRVARLLHALFASTCLDFAALARALGSPGAPPRLGSARELLHQRPETFLPDAQAALDDLLAREILVRDGERLAWGPRADAIHAYRAACAESPTPRA